MQKIILLILILLYFISSLFGSFTVSKPFDGISDNAETETDDFIEREHFNYDLDDYISVGDTDNLKVGFRKEKLDEETEDAYKESKYNAVWDAIAENTSVVKYPEKELKEEIEHQRSELKLQLSIDGISLDDYVNNTYSGSKDKFEKELENIAKEQVRNYMIIYSLQERYGIGVTEEDYDSYLSKLFEKNGPALDISDEREYEERYTKKVILAFLIREKVLERVSETAEFV